MDPKDVRPAQEPPGIPPMVQWMMEKMCRTGEFRPGATCQRLMASMGTAMETGPRSTPEPSTQSEACAGSAEDEVSGGCCGHRSCCARKRA